MAVTEMHYVESASVEAIGYDADSQELYVRFVESGDVYVYYDVQEWVFEEFLDAGSKGTYYNSNIKGSYQYQQV